MVYLKKLSNRHSEIKCMFSTFIFIYLFFPLLIPPNRFPPLTKWILTSPLRNGSLKAEHLLQRSRGVHRGLACTEASCPWHTREAWRTQLTPGAWSTLRGLAHPGYGPWLHVGCEPRFFSTYDNLYFLMLLNSYSEHHIYW